MTEERIEFHRIPGFPALFNAFISEFPRIAPFFPGDPRSDDDVARTAGERLKKNYARKELADILLARNRRYGIFTAVEENIRAFRDSEDALVLFTGQQPGLLTGPLYTIYKIITTIVAARRFAGILKKPVIPFFWIQGEDHNLTEISRVTVSSKKELIHFKGDAYFPGATKDPVGSLSLEKVLPDLLNFCEKQFGEKAHGSETLALISRAASAHSTVSNFFGALIAGLFGPLGLVQVDPMDRALKKRAAPMIKKIFMSQPEVNRALSGGESALKAAGLEPHIQRDDHHTLVMHISEEGRAALFMRGDRVFVKGFDRVMPAGEVMNMMDESPERFGPNVLSRPLIQDVLFPTLAYTAGPAELSYLGQIMPLYRCFDVPMPLIYPRAGFTLMDARTRRSLAALNLAPADCLISGDLLGAGKEEVLRQAMTGDAVMTEKIRSVKLDLDSMIQRAREIDPGGKKQIAKIQESMLYQLSKLERRTEAASSAGGERMSRHLATVGNMLRPDGKLQERVLNLWQFHAAFGDDLISMLMDRIVFRDFRHIILPVETGTGG